GVDPKNPSRVYALISAKAPSGRGGRGAGGPGGGRAGRGEGAPGPPAPTRPAGREAGVYRRDECGHPRASTGKQARARGGLDRGGGAAYYQEVCVDPYEPDTIWSVNTNLDVSRDGGKTWQQTGFENRTGMHVDHHVVRFDPSDRNHMLIGNDGGVYETYDRG